MLENKIQSDIVMWFSQEYPFYKGCLFCVDNSTYSKKHGASKKAMGVTRGVSDLILLWDGVTYGVEIKSHTKTHDKNHCKEQLEWGTQLELNKGRYFVFTSLLEFQRFILQGLPPKYDIGMISLKIEESKSKVKFD